MSNTDLFGDAVHPIIPDAKLTAEEMGERKRAKRRAQSVARGYYTKPGTGPQGETCKTCKHSYCVEYANRYWKCDRVKASHGPKTDIRINWAACSGWEEKVPE